MVFAYISEKQIRARSHAIWQAEGCRNGHALEHWLRAKAELAAEYQKACQALQSEQLPADIVIPRLQISRRPYRHEASRIGAP